MSMPQREIESVQPMTKKERSNQAKLLAVTKEQEGVDLMKAGAVAPATEVDRQAILAAAAACFPASVPMAAYFTQRSNLWPQVGKMVLGCVDRNKGTIMCYQAYKPEIAIPAAKHNNFITENPLYSATRMTWTKTNFLWMMYRCGWCSKKDQERCLAVEVKLNWFLETLLPNCELASRQTVTKGSARTGSIIQWDPDHTPNYGTVTRRAIQIGMRGDRAAEWAAGSKGPAIVAIHDITDYVKVCRPVAQGHQDFPMPEETVLDDAVFPHLNCPSMVADEELAANDYKQKLKEQKKKHSRSQSGEKEQPKDVVTAGGQANA